MQINNPLQMNDWDIKSFLLLILSIQISLLCLILLDSINIQIPIIRQVFSFISLTFIPGILILRILHMHNLGNTKTVLYSVGLSIASLMLIGLFMNTVYPFIGIPKAISLLNLIITINLFIFLLCIFSYIRDKNFSNANKVQIKKILSPSILFLCLIPFLSIFGTYVLNGYGNNTIQMVLLLIIAIWPLITLIWVREKLYPLVIFILAISLLLHTTLISPYIWGADINLEMTLANYVIKNALWYPSVNIDYNAMLSIVMLAPIYSIISNLSLIWCFKIIYPALFSLVPVALYVVYKKVSNAKIALLACVFFINVNAFYTTLPAVSRQMIAGIFLALILLTLIDEKISEHSKSILLVLFGFSMVVSHYGMTYVFLLIIGISIPILLFLNRYKTKFGMRDSDYKNYKILNIFFPLFILCLTLAWFIYVSNYSIFQNGTIIGYEMINSINDILNPATSQGYYFLSSTSLSYYQSAERFLYLFGNFLIALGVFNLLFDKKINPEFKVLSIASFLILIMAIIFPFFAAAMNTDRIFDINLFFLAVFFVTGFLTAVKGSNQILNKIFKSRSFKISAKKSLYLLTIFLFVFSIFNSAFVYELFDQPKIGRFALDNTRDFYTLNNQEISGIKWLKRNNDPQTRIYGDVYKFLLLLGLIYSDNTEPLKSYLSVGLPYKNEYTLEFQTAMPYDDVINSTALLKNSYVFFGTFNINNQQILVADNDTNQIYYLNDTNLENKIFKVYDNGGSWILKGRS